MLLFSSLSMLFNEFSEFLLTCLREPYLRFLRFFALFSSMLMSESVSLKLPFWLSSLLLPVTLEKFAAEKCLIDTSLFLELFAENIDVLFLLLAPLLSFLRFLRLFERSILCLLWLLLAKDSGGLPWSFILSCLEPIKSTSLILELFSLEFFCFLEEFFEKILLLLETPPLVPFMLPTLFLDRFFLLLPDLTEILVPL